MSGALIHDLSVTKRTLYHWANVPGSLIVKRLTFIYSLFQSLTVDVSTCCYFTNCIMFLKVRKKSLKMSRVSKKDDKNSIWCNVRMFNIVALSRIGAYNASELSFWQKLLVRCGDVMIFPENNLMLRDIPFLEHLFILRFWYELVNSVNGWKRLFLAHYHIQQLNDNVDWITYVCIVYTQST